MNFHMLISVGKSNVWHKSR